MHIEPFIFLPSADTWSQGLGDVHEKWSVFYKSGSEMFSPEGVGVMPDPAE